MGFTVLAGNLSASMFLYPEIQSYLVDLNHVVTGETVFSDNNSVSYLSNI